MKPIIKYLNKISRAQTFLYKWIQFACPGNLLLARILNIDLIYNFHQQISNSFMILFIKMRAQLLPCIYPLILSHAF